MVQSGKTIDLRPKGFVHKTEKALADGQCTYLPEPFARLDLSSDRSASVIR